MAADSNATTSASLLPVVIRTPRLLLRAMRLDDAEAIFSRYASDPEVTRYLCWPTHQSVADTRDFLTNGLREQRAHGGQGWVIQPLDGGPLLGAIGAHVLHNCRIDLGYCLARDAGGQGFVTEAARGVVEGAWQCPAIWRVQAMCDIEHHRSARVLEKIGLEYEGTLRRYCRLPNRSDRPRDLKCYAQVRD